MPPKYSFALLCIVVAAVLAVPAYAADEERELPVVQDEMVLESLPWFNLGRVTTYGGLAVGTDYRGRRARSYLQWDLSTLDAGKPVSKATVRAFLSYKSYPADRPVEARLCLDDNWAWDSITWNSAPQPAATPAGVVPPPLQVGQFYEWDVTELVATELAGDKKLSIVLMEGAAETSAATFKYFAEKEYNGGETQPVLVVAQSAETPDTTAPELTVSCTPDALWPPNHKMVGIELQVTVTDDRDASPTWSLESVASNEPVNGLGDGDTEPDWIIGADGHSLQLRAERSGTGDGRTYTITCRATDAAGNATTATCTVRAAHDQGGKGKS